jgi:hypothetical protein
MTENPNIKQHADFENLVFQGLKFGGIHLCAGKSHGKTRLLFSIAETLQKDESVRLIAFDSSETWIYSASKIPVFNIGDRDILAIQKRTIDEIERYSLQNFNLVKLALNTNKDLLFRFKCRQPSRKGFFVRTIVNFMDSQQRLEKAQDPEHENKKAICFIIEEASNVFNSRSTASQECETFLSVFNEGRNMRESFITASQRLTDFSKTVRSKQIYCLGKMAQEDITPQLRRIEKQQGLDFSNMKTRTWFYEGETFISPEFKQQGKPFIINNEIKKLWLDSLPKPKTLKEKILSWFAVRKAEPNPLFKPTTSENLDDSEPRSVYNESEEMDKEIEDDGLIEDELGL